MGIHPLTRCTTFRRVKLILACQEVLKWVWPSWTNIECSMFKPPHYLHACTKNLPTHGKFYKQNNQLLTKSHVELNNNSIVKRVIISPLTEWNVWCWWIPPPGLSMNQGWKVDSTTQSESAPSPFWFFDVNHPWYPEKRDQTWSLT